MTHKQTTSPLKPSEQFILDAESKAFDIEHKRKLTFNIGRYDHSVAQGKQQYANLELARMRAATLKHRSIEYLDRYLLEFEANFTKKGGRIIWAQDGTEAVREISGILERHGATTVVKSKSMVTEEIHLNEALEQKGIEPVETDLGEYIVQVAGEKPYHIVTPAMHKSKEEVAALFHQKFNTPPDATPQQIAAFVREKLRTTYMAADAGITGANFLIADIGGIAITENEGNALMTMAFPKVHIAVCGIEKIIPSMDDLDLFWHLLATHGTGQRITVYNTLITGPRQRGETDGPEELYLVLLDNGRTRLLEATEQRQALMCIRCGACLNACPVYRTIGGHAYGTVYSGPIGSVITQHLRSKEEFGHLSQASSLCGRCTEVCPVKIDVHKHLLYNRRDIVKENHPQKKERLLMKGWKKLMLNRALMDIAGPGIKNLFLKKFFWKQWGGRRELPEIASTSFNRLWRDTSTSLPQPFSNSLPEVS